MFAALAEIFMDCIQGRSERGLSLDPYGIDGACDAIEVGRVVAHGVPVLSAFFESKEGDAGLLANGLEQPAAGFALDTQHVFSLEVRHGHDHCVLAIHRPEGDKSVQGRHVRDSPSVAAPRGRVIVLEPLRYLAMLLYFVTAALGHEFSATEQFARDVDAQHRRPVQEVAVPLSRGVVWGKVGVVGFRIVGIVRVGIEISEVSPRSVERAGVCPLEHARGRI
ncbi:hypothetical protein DSECCO2_298760 [anaerobic digester metagenome]